MTDVPRGLVTVAFLKTKLDEGCDHLGLFEPLILDALAHTDLSDFLAGDIVAIVHDRAGVLLPLNAMQTLLGRCARRGLVDRQGGRFFRTSKPIPDPQLDAPRRVIQAQQHALGYALAQFAAEQGVQLESPTQAVEALATFVSDNKVRLILEEPLPDSPLERSSLDRKLTRVIARFIIGHCLQSTGLLPALRSLIEGIVLSDTLLMRDFPEAAQRFRDLVVVLDTPVLLSAIDMMGTANAVPVKEGLALLREAGARTVAFGRTVEEMRRILAVYEDRIGTTDGRLSLYPTALTQYVLTARLSPSDIRVISSTLESRLAKVGIHLRDIPAHVPRHTLDEEALAKVLVHPIRRDPDEPRIEHDVDCVAGVLTLRAGHVATSIERSVAVFCTTSGQVIRNVQQWYFGQGLRGIPPIVHFFALTSVAWLKKPAAAPSVKLHELAAVCIAAMRPTPETMAKFVGTLRRLGAEGHITDDETAAIVASELIEPLLARLDDDFEPDSESIQQAIERVRESYRREAIAQAEQDIRRTQADLTAIQQAAEEAVRKARAEALEAQRAAAHANTLRTRLIETVEQRISRWSRLLSDGLFWAGVVVVAGAALLSLPGVFDVVGHAAKWTARGILLVAAVLGAYSVVQGTSLKGLRDAVQDRIRARMRSWWLPSNVLGGVAGQGSSGDQEPQEGIEHPRQGNA